MLLAADCSNYARIPTPADIAALKALGVSRVIVGTSYSHDNGDGTYTYIGEDQCRAFEAAGFEVQEYQFIGHLRPTTRPWWLDVEEGETVDQITSVLDLPETERPCGIYTRRDIWINNTGDWRAVDTYPWLDLWYANYDGQRNFDDWDSIAFGGWQVVK